MQNWKDISPRVGFAMDVFGNGRTALKASVARYVAGQQVAVAERSTRSKRSAAPTRGRGPIVDGNGLPLDANGNIQFNELATLDVNADLRPQRLDDARTIPRC